MQLVAYRCLLAVGQNAVYARSAINFINRNRCSHVETSALGDADKPLLRRRIALQQQAMQQQQQQLGPRLRSSARWSALISWPGEENTRRRHVHRPKLVLVNHAHSPESSIGGRSGTPDEQSTSAMNMSALISVPAAPPVSPGVYAWICLLLSACASGDWVSRRPRRR